jgi:glycosyltransferase 2 family protein
MKALKLIILLVIMVLLVFFFVKNIDFHAVLGIIKGINPAFPLIFALATIPQFFMRAFRWGVLLEKDGRKVPLASLYHFTLIGFLITYVFPGRIGEVARPLMLAEKEGLRKSSTLATVVIERLLDLLVVMLLFFVSLFFIHSASSTVLVIRKVSFVAVPAILLVLVLFYTMNHPRVRLWVEKLVRLLVKVFPARMRTQIATALLNFIEGLAVKLSVKQWARLIFWSVLMWTYTVANYWFLMKGFHDLNMQSIRFIDTVPFFTLIFFSAAIPTPGMVGSLDQVSKMGLVGMYGVAAETAVAYTILFHALLITVTLVRGSLAMLEEGLNFGRIRTLRENNEMP